MSLTPSQIRTLKRKAADRSLEVEHLLKVAAIGDAADALVLRELKAEHRWSDTGREGRSRVVPFGRWVDVVSCYLEHGYSGLVELAAKDTRMVEFSIGLLEEFKTAESIVTLLAIGRRIMEQPEENRVLALKLAGAFTLILSVKGSPQIDEPSATTIRRFLHRFLRAEASEIERTTCVCALRGVGDAESLDLIASLPAFRYPYTGLEGQACRRIKARLRHFSDKTA